VVEGKSVKKYLSYISIAVLLFVALDEMYRALLIEDSLEKIADLLSAITSLLLAAFFYIVLVKGITLKSKSKWGKMILIGLGALIVVIVIVRKIIRGI
jgi:hypothetical protein